MKRVSVLIKPASSLCNIKCRYCFYNDISSLREVESFGKMTKETTKRMIEQIYVDLEDGDYLSLAFQGGEPTLAGLSYYQYLIECINSQTKQVEVSYAIQTNGMVINERWCRLFKDNNFLVGLSMDGPAIFHNQGRVDWKQKGTFERVRKTKSLFDYHEISYNVLTVLTNEIAKEPETIFSFIMEEEIKYIQFIPCMDSLTENHQHSFGLSPDLFASFYQKILILWLEELKKNHYISIKLLDDLFHLLVNRQVTACGISGQCSVQYVIEGDGSVYPCDFYVTDDYKLGNIKEHTLRELFSQPLQQNFLYKKREVTNQCLQCPYQNICGGGCKRMKDVMYVDQEDTFCGFKELLDDYTKELVTINQYAGRLTE
ncbi:radical SAM/SPASM domain-containing protein [Vagococcus hydrophili]|uniref:SPASM domain-containing protein n=1 Tax=Vagococcus hydrophili TaxID=2714947 RepID=A0A6G8AUC4_9ENTE|nr:SPASM domain-containing protein [Vagococcus hydrophili]QIL48681.1 SPASM domain-containing protein [Vagococcus hydrophili]